VGSDDIADLFLHQVTAESYLGTSGNGTVLYADPVTVPCLLSRKSQFIRNAQGDQVLAQSTVSADPSFADTLAPKSRVTIAGEDPTFVLIRQISTGGGDIDGLDRVKACLQ
jgi:hypothetical protein